MGATSNWFFWALLSAFFAGVTAVLAKVGVAGVDPGLATAIRTTVVLVFAWALAANTLAGLPIITGRTWLFLVLSGLATGLSWICYFQALSRGLASQVAPVDKLSVVFAIAFAAYFLGEPLGWHQWVGGGLVVAGAIVLATG